VEFKIFFHGVYVIEDIVDYAGDDTLFLGVAYDTFHGMRFPGGRLTVSEYCAVVAGQDVRNDALCGFIVYLFLCGVGLEHLVE
jgi:hypothetical protein